MAAETDRHLLFGLLALQTGLIQQAQLVAAFHAWTCDKSRPLGEHLIELGYLNAAQRAAVEALAALHIEAHGDDVGRSLAAIPAGRSTREGLADLGDPDIEATLGHVASRDATDDGDDDRTTSYSVGTATADGQRFRVLRPHARGGLGEVFVALDAELHREVALKQIQDRHADDPVSRARFLLEAEVTGRLEHPGVVPVYGLGYDASGRPFYAMRFVRGDTLKEAIDRFHAREGHADGEPRWSNLALRQLLSRFVAVCNVVAYAHSRGVIHRDLKPANILLGPYGETLVVDWGLAKVAGRGEAAARSGAAEATLEPGSGSGSSETLPGTALGTPAYMSPEQAEGRLEQVGPKSDVYSLGAMLYYLLTGKPPIDEADVGEALRRVQRGEFPPPRSVQPDIPQGLEAIGLKAMAWNPDERYPSARALADEIERWLADEPVSVYREPITVRLTRWGRRHRTLATSLGVLLVTAVVGLTIATALIRREQLRTEHQRQSATAAALAELKAKQELESSLYFHLIALADRELAASDLGRALELLGECPERLRRWEWHYLNRLCKLDPVILRDKAKAEVNSVAFSPDGERLAAAGGDGTVKVWNCRTQEVVQTLNDNPVGLVYSVAFHPEGKHLAAAGADGKVRVWDLTTEKSVFECPGNAGINLGRAYGVAFSPNGQRLAAGSDGVANIWDWRNRRLLHTLPGDEKMKGSVTVAFSRDGRLLASGSWNGGVKIWDAETGEHLRTLSGHYQPVGALAFSPDGGRLTSAGFDGHAIVWDTKTGQSLKTLRGHDALVLGVAYSPDGLRLATAGRDSTVRVWEAAAGQEVLVLRGHVDRCRCVAFSPDGGRLVSCGQDATIRFWDATPLQGNEGQEALTFREHAGNVTIAAISPDGRRVASADEARPGHMDVPVKVWDVQSGRVSFEFNGHKGIVWCVAWHPDGQRIASVGRDERRNLFVVKVWDNQTGQVAYALPAGSRETFVAAFSPDGRYLATGGTDPVVQVWDGQTGKHVVELRAHDGGIGGLGFSPDSRHLASAGGDGTVKLWDATRLREKPEARLTLRARGSQANMNTSFSPDGRRLVTGGERNTLKIWDVQTGRELRTLSGHKGDVWAATFSPDPDGRWIAWAEEDKAVKVWDSHTETLVHSFRGHTGAVTSVAFAFSPAGRFLVSGSRDGTVKVRDLTHLGVKPTE